MSVEATIGAAPPRNFNAYAMGLLALIALSLLVTFRDGLNLMLDWWVEPEYQHGYLIPVVALYLIWARLVDLERLSLRESWLGVVVVMLGLVGFLIGELSALYAIIQYSFLVTLWGVVLTAIGWRGTRVIWAGLLFLAFMIPWPRFLQWGLSNELQLISSQLGTGFLRLIGISVYLEGNVIDLGKYQMQVVEACSGLRYLFPLASFAFFCAYIFKGPLWQRAIIFALAAPITVVMNSFRIAVTGVLVNKYGIEQAEGFLHYFEGWVIFVACIALLFLAMALFALASGRRLAEVFEVEIPEISDLRLFTNWRSVRAPMVTATILLLAGTAGSLAIQNRQESFPPHISLATFPLALGDWHGAEDRLEAPVLEQLKLTDYLLNTYSRDSDRFPVQLYVAYYESQRKGASVHSPKACLPSGGWRIDEFEQVEIPGARSDGSSLRSNRALVSLGQQKGLIYYWFMQRGRYLTNEYLVKWFIFWDSMTKNRTDGAMVRVMVPIEDAVDIAAADRTAIEFIRKAEPPLYYHIPQEAVAVGGLSGPTAVAAEAAPTTTLR
jgi:exosortase D (VPLPA-CTERM-specific)